MKGISFAYVTLFCAILFWGHNAWAANGMLIRPRASIGLTNYSINLSSSGSSTPVASSRYSSLGGGLTFATKGLYLDMSGSTSLHATHDWPGGYAGDFKRYDSALTLGYLMAGHWSIFAGYKYGVSEFYQANYPGYRLTFKATGPFIGANKAFRFHGGSSASLSAAVADMTGKIYDTGTINDSGNSIGLSFAATYNLPTSRSTGFQFKGYYQNYKYSGFSTVVDAKESILTTEMDFHISF